jgi:hypothetical protein
MGLFDNPLGCQPAGWLAVLQFLAAANFVERHLDRIMNVFYYREKSPFCQEIAMPQN